ncbi:50S ribosomal protein L22 [Candidatus Peregrinibacteria bacterium]|nr:50S ribosomal protein L22 [Candidatus Peregrinibacteria bacterium]
MKMKAVLKNIGISPKKANLVAEMVRGEMVEKALTMLKFTPKKAAGIMYKVIQSAASNATNNFKQSKAKLYIKEIVVNKGIMYKRSQPVSKGRAHPILARRSNITVIVDVRHNISEAATTTSAKPMLPAKKAVTNPKN